RAGFDSVLRRMVYDLNDDHSRWIGLINIPASLDDSDIHQNTNLRPGIGFSHQYLFKKGLAINRVYPETPAAKAGLHRGDLIVSVNGEDISKTSASSKIMNFISDAVNGGEVVFEVLRNGRKVEFDIKPEEINFDRVQDLPQAEMLDKTTGYIYLPSFNLNKIGDKIHNMIAELKAQGAKSLVLDLRDNLGGHLDELGLILGAFIDGDWAQAVGHDKVIWTPTYYLANGKGINKLVTPEGQVVSSNAISAPIKFDGPLALIVSSLNSSAGEISALVLQDLGRATIVGEQTDGNVEAIQIFDLPDGSGVYVAVANIKGINGTDYTSGVTPDVIVKADLDELIQGYDAPVAAALKELKSLPFTPGKYWK
ncbi:MAG TPA: PDZ domain-containing protein, partial [Thioploca sp.]|nr:PDZ domain-containing protein [Thioploca sp.]